MTVDIFDLRIAMKDIESKQDDMALRWVMLKMWLDKQEAAQQSAQADGLTCPDCGQVSMSSSTCTNCGILDTPLP